MPEPGARELVPRPTIGRVFTARRRIRLADVDPSSRCRLDASVRHLQDVARDDSADSGLAGAMNWVVRRVLVEMRQAPVFQEQIGLATWCSGHGARWAERRTSITGELGASVEASAVWIFVDGDTGAPKRLADDFFTIYGATADERIVSARLSLPTTPSDAANDLPWPVRYADLDVLGHVNNAAQWVAVEEAMYRAGVASGPVRAELEHGPGVEPGDVHLRWESVDGGVDTWLMTDSGAGSVGRVRPLAPPA